MELLAMNKKEEPLLYRTMVSATLVFDKSTPSYPEVILFLAGQLKINEKLISIRHVYNLFGEKKAELIAYVYSDEAKKQSIEPKIKEKKEKKAKEQK